MLGEVALGMVSWVDEDDAFCHEGGLVWVCVDKGRHAGWGVASAEVAEVAASWREQLGCETRQGLHAAAKQTVEGVDGGVNGLYTTKSQAGWVEKKGRSRKEWHCLESRLLRCST